VKNKVPFALGPSKTRYQSREKYQNWIILGAMLFTVVLTVIDIISDLKDGVSYSHLSGEFLITTLSSVGAVILWKRTLDLNSEITNQKKLVVTMDSDRARALNEATKWKSEAAKVLAGLSGAIDTQLVKWNLTAAEKEVALLLLKGLSLKEVADVRDVSEKTARAQSFSIYAKSGLSGRAELSAFFLEDLMLPAENINHQPFHEFN
jgi:DNA-binding CsgD family transcriptional regulator